MCFILWVRWMHVCVSDAGSGWYFTLWQRQSEGHSVEMPEARSGSAAKTSWTNIITSHGGERYQTWKAERFWKMYCYEVKVLTVFLSCWNKALPFYIPRSIKVLCKNKLTCDVQSTLVTSDFLLYLLSFLCFSKGFFFLLVLTWDLGFQLHMKNDWGLVEVTGTWEKKG